LTPGGRAVAVALPLPLRRAFTYGVPESWERVPAAGVRVRVPFGERVLTGVVLGLAEEPAPDGLRDVLEALDEEPVCPADLLATAGRVAERFFASTGEVLKSALPARLPAPGAIRYRITEQGALGLGKALEGERAVLERLSGGDSVRATQLPGEGATRREAIRSLEERGWIRPVSGGRERRTRIELAYALGGVRGDEARRAIGRGRKARDVLDFLEGLGRPASGAEVRAQTAAGTALLRGLVAKGLLRSFEELRRPGESNAPAGASRFEPTSAQAAAIAAIVDAIRRRRYFPALLEGVTGSGKTEVYLRAIRAALDAGRSAIWLVPEIALTPVFARELSRQFPDSAAVLHSALSERERAQAWDRVRSGAARAVIGPRSAAFAPAEDPGLFVVDEEHDASYKQRESPRYDAREAVAVRASSNGAALVYGSATPSMEAFHAAARGRVAHLLLPERIAARPLPRVEIVDLRRETSRPDEKGVPLFSAPLVRRLREVFAAGQQAILLQPRRGFAPFLLCRDCGHDFRCTRCSVARTVHERGRVLLCHYCGERVPRAERCPQCGGGVLEAIGAGTERVAERFAELFPGVSHAILDRDTARRRGGAAAVVEAVHRGDVACLIGTQMVAKGHDFPRVTAVGVLSADTLLHFPDFRSGEKTFQLLAQVAGRAGRGDAAGTVHVQTFAPEHPAIRRAAVHDVAGFAAAELEFRRVFFYPPFSELAALLISSADRERASHAAAQLGTALSRAAPDLRLSGPAPAPLERLQGRWRFQLLLRADDRRALLSALDAAVPERPPAGVQVAVDVDPQDLL
jgi:primosomal protein N' (replication factor Y) (superfamily II helicase)